MSNIWDDVKVKLGDFAKKAADKAGDFTKDAAEKAEEVTKLGKVKLDKYQIKRDIDKNFIEIGKKAYTLFNDKKDKNISKDEEILSIIKIVDDLQKKMKVKEKEYEDIKSKNPGITEKDIPEEKASTKEKKTTSKKK